MDELLGQIASTRDAEDDDHEETIEIPTHKRRRKKHGRNSIPEELITDVTVDLAEEDKNCSCCGGRLQQFDVKEHLVVDRIPATYTATRYLQPIYGCPKCKDHVTSREMPLVTPIAKGLAGFALMAFVLASKY